MKIAEKSDAYVATSNHEVCIGKLVVARMYVKHDGTKELRIAQGMPRDATRTKLLEDCPEFCRHNGITESTHPLLF